MLKNDQTYFKRGMGVFLNARFSEKRLFYLLAPTKQMFILTISIDNIFSKTQGTILCATVSPNKALDGPCVDI